MLTTLSAYSSWESVPLLPLSERGAHTDLIQIRNIDGLGPVKADVNTAPFGSVDGESFTGAHVPKRNIVITLGLNPDWANWSMEELRRLLYRYFIPKNPVRLIFRSDDDLPDVQIEGYTESVEPSIFAKDVEIQVSIICPDPYFVAVNPTIVTGNVGAPVKTITYNGSIETGYFIKVTQIVQPDATFISVRMGDPYTASFRLPCAITPTKYLQINSIPGNKYVRNVELNTGVVTNLLNNVYSGSTWPVLKPGDNKLQILCDIPSTVAAYELTYYEKFGGL